MTESDAPSVPAQVLKGIVMVLLLALLLVLLFFGIGFAAHLLWIVAVIFFFVWIVGFALGRGESAGRHHFYRW
jgi:hypothetical protein